MPEARVVGIRHRRLPICAFGCNVPPSADTANVLRRPLQLVLRGKAPGAEPIVLDSGAIQPADVRAYRRLVLWVRDGVRRWAPLP